MHENPHTHTKGGPVGSIQSAIKYQMRHSLPQNNSVHLSCPIIHMVIHLSAHTILVHFSLTVHHLLLLAD